MIKVTLYRDSGRIVRVRACGHSGLAEHGSDVLCGAVSALIQTAYLAICDNISRKTEYTSDEKAGLFEFEVPNVNDRHDIDVILRAMYVGLQDLSSGFPQNLILEEA